MKGGTVLKVCRTLAVLAACLAGAAYGSGAMAADHLYPHAERQSGPWGYIDKTGKIVIPLQFEAAQPFSEGLAAVKRNKKLGFIDRTGHLVVDHQFDDAQPFGSGRAAVSVGRAWGLIDETGAVLVSPTFKWIRPFSDGRAIVAVQGIGHKQKFGAIDLAGKVVIAPEYDQMLPFSEALAAVRRGRLWGFVDQDGQLAIPLELRLQVGRFTHGLAKVSTFQGPKAPMVAGFVDRQGKVAIPFDFVEANGFSEGLATVRVANKAWGVVDATGRFVIPPQFSDVGSNLYIAGRGLFSEGLLAVSDGKAFGYVDRQGSFVVPPRFLHAYAFQEGLAVVRVRSEEVFGVPHSLQHPVGVIDRSGQLVVKPVFERIKLHSGGPIQVWFGGRTGYFDSTGRPLTFTDKDVEDYIARKRAQLKEVAARQREHLARHIGPPPAPGRAVVGKAGDTEYYLRVPEGLCALSSHSPEDRKLLEDFWARDAAAAEEAARKLPHRLLPQISEETAREVRKSSEALKSNFGLIASCDQLKSFRAGRDWAALKTYAIATGLQKDRYDFSGNAGIVYIAAFLCTMVDKGKLGMPPLKEADKSARVWTAFKRLEAGEGTSLPALAREPLACYSASLSPLEGDAGTRPGTLPKARVAFHTMVFLPDWLVQVFTKNVPVESPDALFGELEREKAVVRGLQDANLKKKPR